jgi:DNA polymerase I
MQKRLFLLDAYALIFRAYYALIKNPRVTSSGINTNAQYGFTNTVLDIIKKEKPTHLAVAFDLAGPTERHTTYEAYKANRPETPEDLKLSIPYIKDILTAMRIPILECQGYEADDVIGTIAHKAANDGYDVYMVTPDKDYGQLVKPNVFIWKPPAFGNKEEIMGEAEVCAKWDIKNVSQVIDLLGLMGDAVDNIPGIAGVGEKTAAKLLAEYETLENVLANATNIKGKMGEKIAAGAQDAIMSKQLATIILDVPMPYEVDTYIMEEPDKEALTAIFETLEFRTLGKRLLGDSFNAATSTTTVAPSLGNTQMDLFGMAVATPATNASAPTFFGMETNEATIPLKNMASVAHQYVLVNDDAALEALIDELKLQHTICFDTETTSTDANDAEIVGMSFCIESNNGFYVPMPSSYEEAKNKLHRFLFLFEDTSKTWIGHNIKYDMLILKWYQINVTGTIQDTMLAHYLVEPEGRRSMDILSEQYLNYQPVSITTLIGEKGKNQGNMKDVAVELVADYAAEDADVTFQLHEVLAKETLEKGVQNVYQSIECPLVPVLTDMEFEGINIDVAFLNEYSRLLETDIIAAEKNVQEQAGLKFNLASPKQMGEVLFDHLKLDPKAKKTGKSGQYATGEEVLSKLAAKHKIVDDILIYRELSKLKSTYVDALPLLVNKKTGRVHTSYNQAIAVTGRLSSNAPNLQNIPIRTERGRTIRKAFVPRNEDYILMSADYSQIELRIVAAVAGDTNMIDAFKANKDIHTATAAKVYGLPEEEVTKEQRRNAKAVNFGIIYGQSAFGLAENLGISRTEAKLIIDNYLTEFGSIKAYMDTQINFAREVGYVQTLLGRKRWLKDITSTNPTVRGFAERNAINMPIQGSAADMIKLAMIKIHAAMKTEGVKSKMLLQVHDELVFDVLHTEKEIMKKIILTNMESAMQLPNEVPVRAEIGEGLNWLEAH